MQPYYMQTNTANHQSAAVVQSKLWRKNKKTHLRSEENDHSKGPFGARDLWGGSDWAHKAQGGGEGKMKRQPRRLRESKIESMHKLGNLLNIHS